MEKMSFVKACKTFFGFKDGQTLAEFAAELKCLTDQDRADLTALFPSVGIEVTEQK